MDIHSKGQGFQAPGKGRLKVAQRLLLLAAAPRAAVAVRGGAGGTEVAAVNERLAAVTVGHHHLHALPAVGSSFAGR